MKRKKLKGLSLVEIIISIAVYAIIALLMAEIMGAINSTMSRTSNLDERLDTEALIVDNWNINPSGVRLADDENSTHFRFMSFSNRELTPDSGPDGEFTFKIKLSRDLDDASFAALPGNDKKKVTGIDRVVVRSNIDLLDGPIDNRERVDKIEFSKDDLRDRLHAGDDFITVQLPYERSINPVVTIDIYATYERGVHFDASMNPDDIKYIRTNFSFVQFSRTDGSESQTVRYEEAVYKFDGQSFESLSSSRLPVLVQDDGPVGTTTTGTDGTGETTTTTTTETTTTTATSIPAHLNTNIVDVKVHIGNKDSSGISLAQGMELIPAADLP